MNSRDNIIHNNQVNNDNIHIWSLGSKYHSFLSLDDVFELFATKINKIYIYHCRRSSIEAQNCVNKLINLLSFQISNIILHVFQFGFDQCAISLQRIDERLQSSNFAHIQFI